MKNTTRWILIAVLWTVIVPQVAAAEDPSGRWIGPDGTALPFHTDEEILAFLRDAKAKKVGILSTGINRHLKVRLEKDGVEARAVFRTVDITEKRFRVRDQVYFGFRDSYLYECAAYEVSRLVGIDSLPPCVGRRLWGKAGSLQLWIEDTMTERERREKDLESPAPLDWMRHNQNRRTFDALIRNFDRNLGNILIDPDWKMWLVDHGRSFHKSDRIERIELLLWCDREVWENLKGLGRETIRERAGEYLTGEEIKFMLRRRDAIVRHFEERIAELGETVVLYSPGEPPPEDLVGPSEVLLASSSDDVPDGDGGDGKSGGGDAD